MLYNICSSFAVLPCSLPSRAYPPVLCHSASATSPNVLILSCVHDLLFCLFLSLALRLCPALGLLCRPLPTSWTQDCCFWFLVLCTRSCLSSVWSFRVVFLLVHQLDISKQPYARGRRPEGMFFVSFFLSFLSCFFPFRPS